MSLKEFLISHDKSEHRVTVTQSSIHRVASLSACGAKVFLDGCDLFVLGNFKRYRAYLGRSRHEITTEGLRIVA